MPCVMTIDEKHYSLKELSEKWGYSTRALMRLFEDEPGVLVIARPETRNKRGYCTRRIPASVAERVYRGLQQGRGR